MKLVMCRQCAQPLLANYSVCPRCECSQPRHSNGVLWYCCAMSLVALIAVVSRLFLA